MSWRQPRLRAVLTLPEGFRAVEDEAFAGLAAVTGLVIPEGMESVGSRAFADSGLTEITLPATLTAIADDAFAYCLPGLVSDGALVGRTAHRHL